MSKNEKKWVPLSDWLETHLKKLQQRNEKIIDEATRPAPKQEEVN